MSVRVTTFDTIKAYRWTEAGVTTNGMLVHETTAQWAVEPPLSKFRDFADLESEDIILGRIHVFFFIIVEPRLSVLCLVSRWVSKVVENAPKVVVELLAFLLDEPEIQSREFALEKLLKLVFVGLCRL